MLKYCEVCGKGFEWQDFGGRYKNKRYCSRACGMAGWRKTDKGKALVVKSNLRHKRPDIAQICVICGKGYISARVRDVCDVPECQTAAKMYRTDKMFAKNPNILAAYRHIDSLRKKVKRGTLNRPYCSVCGTSDNVQWHHPDYSKPLQVIPLCRAHHKEAHRKTE